MEQVINAKERRYAFVKFILFFSLTVAIILVAVYFDTLIPNHENELLRKRIATFENQIHTQEQYRFAMEEVKSLIDSSNRSGKVNLLLDLEIAKKLEAMSNLQFQDSSLYSRLNKNIFLILDDYRKMNESLLSSNSAIQEVDKLKMELDKYKQQLEDANRDLDFWRNRANLAQ